MLSVRITHTDVVEMGKCYATAFVYGSLNASVRHPSPNCQRLFSHVPRDGLACRLRAQFFFWPPVPLDRRLVSLDWIRSAASRRLASYCVCIRAHECGLWFIGITPRDCRRVQQKSVCSFEKLSALGLAVRPEFEFGPLEREPNVSTGSLAPDRRNRK